MQWHTLAEGHGNGEESGGYRCLLRALGHRLERMLRRLVSETVAATVPIKIKHKKYQASAACKRSASTQLPMVHPTPYRPYRGPQSLAAGTSAHCHTRHSARSWMQSTRSMCRQRRQSEDIKCEPSVCMPRNTAKKSKNSTSPKRYQPHHHHVAASHLDRIDFFCLSDVPKTHHPLRIGRKCISETWDET